MKNVKIFFLFGLLLLVGCRVGPRYVPPCSEVPEAWKQNLDNGEMTPVFENWWEVFDDSHLNDLEQQAIVNNPNIYIALERVSEARALAGIEAASFYPQLTLNPQFQDYGMLFKPFLPPNFFSAFGAPGQPGVNVPSTMNPFRIHQFLYTLPLNLNYELDLWGKLRDRYDSAFYNYQAEIEGYYGALLTLTAELATNYFNLRSLDAEIVNLKANIETRDKNYQLTQSRFDKGIVNYLDVTQAQVDLSNVKANLDDALRLRTLAENQIAVLVGVMPSCFHLESFPLNREPPLIPPGIPSAVLLRRPDIAQAERVMASQHALIGAAYASFFPSISLTGALGYSSPDISQFLKWISRFWMIGADMSQMVFDGGRDASNLQAAFARFGEASGAYQQQVLIAFQEVEDALSNIMQYKNQSINVNQAVEASKKATTLSVNRYTQGIAIYLEVVENERLKLQAEINGIHLLYLRYAATIQLIKALGGGWGPGCEFEK